MQPYILETIISLTGQHGYTKIKSVSNFQSRLLITEWSPCTDLGGQQGQNFLAA